MTPGVMSEVGGACAALYCGMVIGLVYDVFRLIRLPLRSWWLVTIADAAYYAAAFGIAAAGMLYINCGTLRLYVLFFIAAGIYLYVRFPGRLIGEAGRRIKEKFIKKQLHGRV